MSQSAVVCVSLQKERFQGTQAGIRVYRVDFNHITGNLFDPAQ